MTIEFTVPYPARKSAWTKRYGLNAYWSGKNHHVRAADARDLEALVRSGIAIVLHDFPRAMLDELGLNLAERRKDVNLRRVIQDRHSQTSPST